MQGKGWVAAKELVVGDKLKLLDGGEAFVDVIATEQFEEPVKVYNFEVEEFHTYFVGAAAVLVHNMCQSPDKVAKKLGYNKLKERVHNKPVYHNSKVKRALKYISPDYDSHNGGYWKAAEKIEALAREATRSGTCDIDLNYIGK